MFSILIDIVLLSGVYLLHLSLRLYLMW